jgi:hypothetical protein
MDFSAVYGSLDEAEAALRAQGHALGFDLAIKERFPRGAGRDEVTRVNYRCAKGRTPAARLDEAIHDSKKRKTSTQMTSCEYKINLKRVPGAGWKLEPVRTRDGHELAHNHDLLEPYAFASFRKQGLAAHKDKIIADWRAGTRPSQIMANLRGAGDTIDFNYKDLSNLLHACRREELNGRTPIEWLYEVHIS